MARTNRRNRKPVGQNSAGVHLVAGGGVGLKPNDEERRRTSPFSHVDPERKNGPEACGSGPF